MRYVPIERVEAGMLLAQSIFDDSDKVLMEAYAELTAEQIDRLTEKGYSGVYIEDELSKDIEIQDTISRQLRNNAVKSLKGCDIDQTMNIAESIVEEIISKKTFSLDMIDLRSFDEYTYRHSVNVAVLATIIGMGMELDSRDLVNLCAAAILHDLGKLEIDERILNKPGKLTEEEFAVMKQHPVRSYELLKAKWTIPAETKEAVLFHHENEDGSGYPNGISGEQIPLYAKIIHVVDVYDALTSKRPYKKPYSPSEAMEYLMGGCGKLFDHEIVRAFMTKVPLYQKGMNVALSTGETAIVVENSRRNNMRPIVRLSDGTRLDLNDGKRLNITILGIPGEDILEGDKLIQYEKNRNDNKKYSNV